MKKISIAILLFFLAFVLQCAENKKAKENKKDHFHSENIRKEVFENVIEITDSDVIKKGNDYIFKVALPKSNETPVLFVTSPIPLAKLSDMYPDLPKLIVITPNWPLYDEVANSVPSDVGCAEPRTSNIIYEFIRENGRLKKDSIVIMDTFPVMKFKKVRE